MVNSDYYRRQADLFLQLALTQPDQRLTYRLIELAEQYQARAGEAAFENSSIALGRDNRRFEARH
jgi:hypothetical protein